MHSIELYSFIDKLVGNYSTWYESVLKASLHFITHWLETGNIFYTVTSRGEAHKTCPTNKSSTSRRIPIRPVHIECSLINCDCKIASLFSILQLAPPILLCSGSLLDLPLQRKVEND